ncbi:ABC transporter substrate-binding protein [Paraburkholderia sp. SIMBA_055]|jgi:lysine/arginine/ornithine transport system substrate-binding protein|uniref:Extracellular solute-binding protein family 3 n=3 Tax=Paraburkholderia TaxID=1822464 RepID=B1FSX4_PARG4|nr:MULTISPECIES: ABC transporter substrate-binding protein [Paraburkholderia]AXF10555.1 ABC transporter substrate-binding protein [Paraburkholderia graminis]EDT12700.1 extracellular solute-binding protein family 3 [Paraburkholderia graminis C4D1M]MDQ0625047.1 lysine/arginine/ornithine transport system substrate-binding protein [Paraburkholderia graminis]MDR6206202.1 lysine/arginine/ornithine transport system substrate-binding protein [Paraburkholderia graminis]MDR6470238.1 lysine/arginine/orni
MLRKLQLSLFVAAAVVAGAVGSVGTASAETQNTLRFGIEAAYPPFESKTATGQLQGFDVDVGNAVCAKMAVKCEWVENAFDGLIPALQARKFDVINSAMNITAKRKQTIDFTRPIYIVPIVMVAKRGSGLMPDVKSMQGKRVGVLQGSSQEDFLKAHWANAGVSVVSYADQDQVYTDLVAGRLDAAVQETQTVEDGFLKKPAGHDYAIAGQPLSDPATLGEGTGFGLRKGDKALAKKVDAALEALKKDGTLSALSQKYFNRDIIAK